MGFFNELTYDKTMPWVNEFEKLGHVDFERLDIDKDKLYNILETLYKWKVIR
jgi:hypothetical protein